MTKDQVLKAAVETLRVLWHSRPGMTAEELCDGERYDLNMRGRGGTNVCNQEDHLRWMVGEMLKSTDPETEPPTIPETPRMSNGALNRWLGFVQGAAWANGDTTINYLREVNIAAKKES